MSDEDAGSLRLASHSIVEYVEDGAVVLDLRQSRYLRLNATGACIVRALESGASHQTLIDALVDEFHVEPRTASQDASTFVELLVGRGLLA